MQRHMWQLQAAGCQTAALPWRGRGMRDPLHLLLGVLCGC